MKKIFALLFCSLLLMQCTCFSKTYTLDKKFEGELFCLLYGWTNSGSTDGLTWKNVSINNAALPNCKESYAISAVINGVWYNDIFVSVDFNGIVTFKTYAPFIYENFSVFYDYYGTDNVDDALQGCLDFGGIDFLYALSKVKTKQYMEEFVKKRDIIGLPLLWIGGFDRDSEFTIIESKKETESSYKLIATLATGASKIPVVCYAVDDDETRGLKKGDKVKFFGGGTLVDIEYSEKDGTISRLILKDCSVQAGLVRVENSKLNDSSFSESWKFTKKLPKRKFGYLFDFVYKWLNDVTFVPHPLSPPQHRFRCSIDRVDTSLNDDEEKYLVSVEIRDEVSYDCVRYKDVLISRSSDGVITISYKADCRLLAESFVDYVNRSIRYSGDYLNDHQYDTSWLDGNGEKKRKLMKPSSENLRYLYIRARARIEKQEIEKFIKEVVIGKQWDDFFGINVSSVIKTGQKSCPYKITGFGIAPTVYYPADDIDDFGVGVTIADGYYYRPEKKISELKEGDLLCFNPSSLIITDVESSENGFTLVVKDAVTTKEKYDKLREWPSVGIRSSGELMINGKVYSGDND